MGNVYRYRFGAELAMEEVESALLLAIWGTESLYGETRVSLEAGHAFDAKRRTCAIDAGTDAGQDLNRLFVGFLRREFGEDAFRVERVAELAAAAA